MAEVAARAGDNIHHTSALAGFIVGTIIGAALIGYVAFATFTCGFGAALLAGFLAGYAANAIRSLGEWIGSQFTSTTGKILLPGCSGNVFINGRNAARAIISTAVCSKDMPMAPIAEGSANVFINQNPAARKDDKIQCGAIISDGSENVFIGGGKVQYLEIKDEIPEWVRKASDIAFTVAGIVGGAAGAFKQLGGPLNKCALKFIAGYVAGEVASEYISDKAMGFIGGLFGNPVDLTTGQKILFDEQELDFVLSARLPLFWQRYYSSELDEGYLGKGWRLDFEVSLTRQGTEIMFCGRTGQKTLFPGLEAGEYSYSAESQLYFYRLVDGRHVVRSLDDIFTVFPDFHHHQSVRAEHIEDMDQNVIRFHYEGDNQDTLTGVSDSQNNYLICHWDADKKRLLSVDQVVDGVKECAVRYSYDEQGNLSDVFNSAGVRTRRFTYDENDLMVSHTNVSGMQCFYRWQFTDFNTWCVVESHNSEGERARYTYDIRQRQTRVIDERELKATWFYNEQQQITRFEDFNQDVYEVEYNAQSMPVLFILPGERQIKIERDGLNRIVKETDPLDQIFRTDYHLNTLKIIRKTGPDGAVWQASYDEKGHLLNATDPCGHRTCYAFDERGLPVRITDAGGGEKQLVWDEKGQLVQHTDCSGKSTYYTWTPRGDLASIRNMQGEVTSFVYNSLHELQAIHHPDATQETFSYYPSGQLRFHQNAAGQRREWRYNQRGQPLQSVDRLSRTIQYDYDARGNLSRLLNANGGEYRFRYDVSDRLAEEWRPDSTRRRIEYDAAGRPASLEWLGSDYALDPTQRRTKTYEYDRGDRPVSCRTEMTTRFYTHDAVGRLVGLERRPTAAGEAQGILPCLLQLRRDKNGRVLEEVLDGETTQYRWGALGELTALTLPDNTTLQWLHYGSGHVSAIRCDNEVVTEFERDDLHREIRRSQGALTQWRGYDARGRRHWQSACAGDGVAMTAARAQQGKVWRRFHFDLAGELVKTEDRFRGVQRYRYDAESRLLGYELPGPEGGEERFSYDRADNMFALPEVEWDTHHNGRPEGFRSNRLPFWKGTGYRYDGFGNLTERTQGSGTQYFRYDDENRLIKAWGEGPEGRYQAEYRYDVLGRRTSKRVVYGDSAEAEETHFRWEGLRLVQERRGGTTRSYVYDPDEHYTPLARITGEGERRETEYFHTDLNGTPLEVTDGEGRIRWCGKYRAWGRVIPHVRLEEERGGLAAQPLRYPGQYSDEETGLHYNTLRYYDPEVGRFTTQDPIGLAGGLNIYQYAPNPLGWIDPLGLSGDKINVYKDAPYHSTTDNSVKSRAPTNGQVALDNSVQVKPTSPRRVGVDVANNEIVILDKTRSLSDGVDEYHGHVRDWDALDNKQQSALIKSGKTTRKGKICGG